MRALTEPAAQEAADTLAISRVHIVKLLESCVLAFHKAGRDWASERAMEDLARQAPPGLGRSAGR